MILLNGVRQVQDLPVPVSTLIQDATKGESKCSANTEERKVIFKKWHNIENTYRQKHIDFFLDEHPELKGETYVILEKLYGSNFQWFFRPGEPVKAGSRNQYLDISGSFQGASIAQLAHDSASIITYFQHWSNTSEHGIRLFGELIGPGIGKGVDYGNKKRVLYFGIMVNEKLLPFKQVRVHIATEDAVPLVAIVSGLQKALDFDAEFDSMVLEKPDNICEGVVIQPYEKVYHDRYGTSPFILKKKNDKFKEKETAPRIHVVDSEVEQLNAEFSLYITDNRIQSVFSKHGEIASPKQIGQYIRLVLADAKEDFVKDFQSDTDALDKARQRQVFNVGSTIANMLKDYL